jgi:nuclear transport factor 2 (NTF2) superfamily protein
VVKGTGLSVDQGALGITGNRIVVRYAYEWHADSGNCNESWGFGQDGVMINRFVVSTTCQLLNRIASSTGRVAVDRSDHPSLSELGF